MPKTARLFPVAPSTCSAYTGKARDVAPLAADPSSSAATRVLAEGTARKSPNRSRSGASGSDLAACRGCLADEQEDQHAGQPHQRGSQEERRPPRRRVAVFPRGHDRAADEQSHEEPTHPDRHQRAHPAAATEDLRDRGELGQRVGNPRLAGHGDDGDQQPVAVDHRIESGARRQDQEPTGHVRRAAPGGGVGAVGQAADEGVRQPTHQSMGGEGEGDHEEARRTGRHDEGEEGVAHRRVCLVAEAAGDEAGEAAHPPRVEGLGPGDIGRPRHRRRQPTARRRRASASRVKPVTTSAAPTTSLTEPAPSPQYMAMASMAPSMSRDGGIPAARGTGLP